MKVDKYRRLDDMISCCCGVLLTEHGEDDGQNATPAPRTCRLYRGNPASPRGVCAHAQLRTTLFYSHGQAAIKNHLLLASVIYCCYSSTHTSKFLSEPSLLFFDQKSARECARPYLTYYTELRAQPHTIVSRCVRNMYK